MANHAGTITRFKRALLPHPTLPKSDLRLDEVVGPCLRSWRRPPPEVGDQEVLRARLAYLGPPRVCRWGLKMEYSDSEVGIILDQFQHYQGRT